MITIFIDHVKDISTDVTTKSSASGDEKLIINFMWPKLHLKTIKFLSPVNSYNRLKISFCLEISIM